MQPLDLNLASRPFRNNTLLWTGYVGAAVLLVAFAIWNVTGYRYYGQQLASTRDNISGIEQKLADLDRRETKARNELNRNELDVNRLASQSDGANGVIEWKAFSWTGLFNRMEQVQPWNVTLASVRPMFHSAARRPNRAAVEEEKDNSVIIVVEGFSKSLTALLDFERNLFGGEYFDRPEPKRHQPTDTGEIVFELEFTYYPDGKSARNKKKGAQLAKNEPGAEGEAAAGDEVPAVEALPEDSGTAPTDAGAVATGADPAAVDEASGSPTAGAAPTDADALAAEADAGADVPVDEEARIAVPTPGNAATPAAGQPDPNQKKTTPRTPPKRRQPPRAGDKKDDQGGAR